MGDVQPPHDGAESEASEVLGESATETGDLVIVTGGIVDESYDEEVESIPEEAAPESEAERAAEFTLDELVAEMAGVSAATISASPEQAAVPATPDHADPLAAAMSELFSPVRPLEEELWTRIPFWVIGTIWAVFSGVLTFLLWEIPATGLESAPLYGTFIYGGIALAVVSLVTGAIVWSRARARADLSDRAIVSRALMLRAVGWMAAGVGVWVIALVMLSLHSLDVF